MTKIVAAMLLAAVLPGAAVAQASFPAVHVSYADLNLHNPAGIKVLDRRIASAIRAVCPDANSIGPWSAATAARCRKAKLAEVASQRAAALARAERNDVAVASAR